MLRSSTTLLLSVFALALAGSTIACNAKTSDEDTNANLQAVKKKDGNPTGNGKTCSWSGVSGVTSWDPPVSPVSPAPGTTAPSTGSSGGCTNNPDGEAFCWTDNTNGQPTDLPAKKGGSSGSSSGGCVTDDKGNTSCWTDPSPPDQPVTPTPSPATYQLGDWFPSLDGCNKCTCTDVGIMCTVLACGAPPVEPPPVTPPPSKGCLVDGKWLEPGTRFGAKDNCNTCTCGADGQVACTEMGCVEPPSPPVMPPPNKGCDFSGKWIPSGTSFSDGCNSCSCGPNGEIACTDRFCGDPQPKK